MINSLLALLFFSTAAIAAPAMNNGTFINGTLVNNTSINVTALVQEEILAVDQVERIDDVAATNGNVSFVFDFLNAPNTSVVASSAGNITTAFVGTFPALQDTGASMYLFQIGPCGMVLPHTHPRASEFVVVTEGALVTQFLTETGSEVFTNTLGTYQATIFPQGSLHVEFNPNCTPMKFIGAFDNPDPGTFFVVPGFFSFEEELVLTQLGGAVSGVDLNSVIQAIPQAGVVAVQQCLATCNMTMNQKRNLKDLLPW
jgi:hypothetical protein